MHSGLRRRFLRNKSFNLYCLLALFAENKIQKLHHVLGFIWKFPKHFKAITVFESWLPDAELFCIYFL